MELTCPKCAASMRAYERNGITVDQCTGCRGIFLDRGELEHLMDGEDDYYQAPQQGRAQPPQQQPQYGNQQQYYPKKKKNFLSEILDF
jgi:Zn-finger nucleic acid-binding protein